MRCGVQQRGKHPLGITQGFQVFGPGEHRMEHVQGANGDLSVAKFVRIGVAEHVHLALPKRADFIDVVRASPMTGLRTLFGLVVIPRNAVRESWRLTTW